MSDGKFGINRRGYLASVGGMAAGSLISAGFVTAQTSAVIGDFEDGLDGWRTNGSNELVRTTEADTPWAVTSGDYALSVRSTKDPQPMIERHLEGSLPAQYMLADLSVSDMNDEPARTTIEARVRYNRSGGRGKGGNRGGGRKSGRGKPVETLEAKEVPYGYQGTLAWDLGDLDEHVRSNAKRIQLVWRRSDADTKENPNGNGPGQSYSGTVTWDNVRFSDDADAFQRTRLARQIRNLRSKHGDYQYEYGGLEDGKEVGTYAFADGTEIRATFAPVAEGEWKLTVGDESYELQI